MAVKTPAPVWKDFVSGSLGADLNAIAAGSTQTMSSPGLSKLPAITSGSQIATIVLDPFGVKGSPEIVYVTAHAASATTATIKRIAGQALRTHKNAEQWVHGPTALDFAEFQTQLNDVMQKSLEFTAAGQLLGSTAAATTKSISIGSQHQVLAVDTAIDTKLSYKYVPFVCTASARPSSPYEGMHIYETDTDHTLVYRGATDGWCYVDLPPGTIRMTAASTLEPGEVWCDGTMYNGALTKYAALYAKISKQYGGGTASNFRVPDLRSKFVYAWDTANGGASTEAGALGSTGGATSVTLNSGQIAPHAHPVAAHTHSLAAHTHSGTTSQAGSHIHWYGFDGKVYRAWYSQYQLMRTGIFPDTYYGPQVEELAMDPAGDHQHTITTGGPSVANTGSTSLTTSNNTWTQQPVDTMPPYVVLGYAIRL